MHCTNCKTEIPESELIPFGEERICAACKPHYIQRIKENAQPEKEPLFKIRAICPECEGRILRMPQISNRAFTCSACSTLIKQAELDNSKVLPIFLTALIPLALPISVPFVLVHLNIPYQVLPMAIYLALLVGSYIIVMGFLLTPYLQSYELADDSPPETEKAPE
ncbi:hypothetical protein BVY04_03895 [bacterium M21]|nr:hypothetical protein BVY04_03895 [bacterium M21]